MENHEITAVFEEIASLMRIVQDDPKWQFKAVVRTGRTPGPAKEPTS
jgi:hypothetical protein